MARLKDKKIDFQGPYGRFDNDEQILSFKDSDGLEVDLVAHESAIYNTLNASDGPIPVKYAIRGFYSITLSVEGYERTDTILRNELGFLRTKQDNNRFRYEIHETSNTNIIKEEEGIVGAHIVDILCLPNAQQASIGIGSVHHVALRTPTFKQQEHLRDNIIKAGLNATLVIYRYYFHSVYFREPGGILFEIATNPPGFTVDEKRKELGSHLVLPPWLESARKDIQKTLTPVRLPSERN
ncbi:MAG: VOC family protein [Candidatus Nitrosocosmicus sp.]|nr:VOC family protein [Candidatus Nitrosocosmicus sp.]MDN5867371.1 VOC family protein [Candidatus Nitrosocosmicus sp.]